MEFDPQVLVTQSQSNITNPSFLPNNTLLQRTSTETYKGFKQL